jgi:hypothetical protein
VILRKLKLLVAAVAMTLLVASPAFADDDDGFWGGEGFWGDDGSSLTNDGFWGGEGFWGN